MKGQFLTDRGKVRNLNEDAGGIFYNKTGQILAIVADGMGGHQAGEVASKMATTIVQKDWEKNEQITSPEEAENWLLEIIKETNLSIHNYAQGKEQYEGMGTTIVITLCTDDFVTVAHIGDSRCYLLNEKGFKQITEDHSLVNELIRSGQISEGDAEQHPRKNILTKALGPEKEVMADAQTIGWESGNKLLLCSDGLTNKLADEELSEHLQTMKSIMEVGQTMIDLANDRGGEDNISLAIVVKGKTNEEGESSC